jgi:hypothetical protein
MYFLVIHSKFVYIYCTLNITVAGSYTMKHKNTDVLSQQHSHYTVLNVFQTKLGFSKVAFYPQNLKKKRNYADTSHFWLKNLIFVEKPSNVNTFRTITLFS